MINVLSTIIHERTTKIVCMGVSLDLVIWFGIQMKYSKFPYRAISHQSSNGFLRLSNQFYWSERKIYYSSIIHTGNDNNHLSYHAKGHFTQQSICIL